MSGEGHKRSLSWKLKKTGIFGCRVSLVRTQLYLSLTPQALTKYKVDAFIALQRQ